MTLDLPKIIRRLELIKNMIALEEEKDITEQISKLQQLQLNEAVNEIINLIKQNSYSKAVQKIEIFISSNHQVAFYLDPEIEALRFEAKALEIQIQELSNEKVELDKLLHEFSVRHNQELGELIIKILEHRKSNAKNIAQKREADKDYEDFYTNYQSTKTKTIAILSFDEQKDLKNKYRQASKLCHPDVVEESYKQEAHKIFTELNEAYESNNLKRVSEIFEDLKNGKTFTSKSDTANEKLSLTNELERLKEKFNELNNAISFIKTSQTFQKIKNITDWDLYFSKLKEQLVEQLSSLGNGTK